jgi:hypothetical protein
MLKNPTSTKGRTSWAKFTVISRQASPASILGVAADYYQRDLVNESRMARIKMETHSSSVWDALCNTTRNSNIKALFVSTLNTRVPPRNSIILGWSFLLVIQSVPLTWNPSSACSALWLTGGSSLTVAAASHRGAFHVKWDTYTWCELRARHISKWRR